MTARVGPGQHLVNALRGTEPVVDRMKTVDAAGGGAVRKDSATLRAAIAVVLLLVLFVVLALPFILVAALIGMIISGPGFITGGQFLIVVEILTALTALGLETAGPRRLPVGLAPTRREQPGLWLLVRSVAREMGVPEPDGLVLTGGTSCELRTLRRPGPSLRRHLVLGTALPLSLNERRLRLVIAHALGHARRRRPNLLQALAGHGVD